MTRPGLNFSVRVGYAMGNVKPQTTKRAEEPPVRRSVRVGAASLGVLVMALLAAAFSGAVRGQAPAASSSAPYDPSGAAAAPWEWPTPDARPLEIDRGAAGVSKTREEALEVWGHDRLLEDAVRVVRMTRPLVITSVFVGGPTDGHGHHAAAGQIAQEVFAAAGDPKMFPEQIGAGLRPWSPMKMYARVPLFPLSDKGMFDSAPGK